MEKIKKSSQNEKTTIDNVVSGTKPHLFAPNMSIITKHWPEDAPDYNSPEGWEFEKKMELERLKKQLKK